MVEYWNNILIEYMRKVGGFMVDKERLARLEVLIDNTIEQLQSLKETERLSHIIILTASLSSVQSVIC